MSSVAALALFWSDWSWLVVWSLPQLDLYLHSMCFQSTVMFSKNMWKRNLSICNHMPSLDSLENISRMCISIRSCHVFFFFKGQSLSCMFCLAQLMARGLKPWTFRLGPRGPQWDGWWTGEEKDGVMVGMPCVYIILVGGLEHQFYFPKNIGFLIIPIDELMFFRGVAQPPTSITFFWICLLFPNLEACFRWFKGFVWFTCFELFKCVKHHT